MPSKKRKKSSNAAPTPSGVTRIVQRESVSGKRLDGGQSGRSVIPKKGD